MDTAGGRALFYVWILVMVLGLAVAESPLVPPAGAQSVTVRLSACKKASSRADVGGSVLETRECGNRFTTEDKYAALVVELQRVLMTTRVAIQLLDPEQNSVFAERDVIEVVGGTGYSRIWYWFVIPIAADVRALAVEHVSLALHAIQMRGRPARERPGEWTLRATINDGANNTFKFMLEAVPGAPPPPPATSPTPATTPAAAPSPTPVPSPTASP